jgi:UDP-glucose:(heptosyl)LPS alpha-1,3-glucosyltransferase
MVIAEAMAAAVPVVISDRCGIAPDVANEAGRVLALGAPLADWVAACEGQLARATPPRGFVRSWEKVATEQASAYRQLGRPAGSIA